MVEKVLPMPRPNKGTVRETVVFSSGRDRLGGRTVSNTLTFS